MRLRVFIWLLLPVVFMASCSLIYDQPGDNCPELSIAIEFPENFVPETRATEGEVPAETDENTIHDLAIWVFYSSGEHKKVGSLLVNNDADLPTVGGVRKYAIQVDQAFMLERPKVDVFVLVNRASIGCDLTENSSWEAVNDAVFGGDNYFSPKVPVSSVPDNGLPMSGVGKGLTVGGEEPFLKVPTISLSRTVSKLRFVFCQMYTENNTENSVDSEEFAIERVVLNGNQIPMYEYVFSTEAYRIQPDNYVSASMEILWPNTLDLKYSDAPEIYSYAGQDGPSYEQLIKDGIKTNHLSHLGTYYLRESNKILGGTVYYTVTKAGVTTHRGMGFNMAAPGDFARNHVWTVYGYFISNRTLQMAVSAVPWDKNNYTIEFSTASLQVTQKFIVDENSATIVPAGPKDHYNVFLEANRPATGYLYVTTPQGGKLEIIKDGAVTDVEAFTVTPGEATINPSKNGGRIDIIIDRNRNYSGDPTGKTITLTFKAYTPDGDREISGASECIDQVYHFYL